MTKLIDRLTWAYDRALEAEQLDAQGKIEAAFGSRALMCAAGPDGTGFALKVEDGGTRAVRPATAAFAARLGINLPQLAVISVDNSLGERVGQIRAVP